MQAAELPRTVAAARSTAAALDLRVSRARRRGPGVSQRGAATPETTSTSPNSVVKIQKVVSVQ